MPPPIWNCYSLPTASLFPPARLSNEMTISTRKGGNMHFTVSGFADEGIISLTVARTRGETCKMRNRSSDSMRGEVMKGSTGSNDAIVQLQIL